MITIKKGCFNYQTTPILNNISLTIQPNTITALIGPNGSGKSTLLKCLALPNYKMTGDITLNKIPLATLDRTKEIAWMSSHLEVTSLFSGVEIVMLGQREENKDEAIKWLEWCGCGEEMYRPYPHCSAGQQQKIQLARTIAQETPVLLLDEPFTHMDLKYQNLITSKLKNWAKDTHKCLVIASHNLDNIEKCCDHAILIKRGEIKKQGSLKECFTSADLSDLFETHVH